MEYYHVRIAHGTNGDEIRLDLSREKLENNIINPYDMGDNIFLNGVIILLAEIKKLHIAKTDQSSNNYRERAARDLYKIYGHLYDVTDRDIDEYIVDMGDNITDEIVQGVPGWKANVNYQTRASSPSRPSESSRKVFVVHGRDTQARDNVFQFLRAIGLHPLEWSEAVKSTGKPNPYVGEILERAFSEAHAILVLFTPDDEAYLRTSLRSENEPNYETQLSGQARPNVLFEAGMAMGGSEDRTILVELGVLRPFSDIAGRHTIKLDNTSQRRQELAQRLQAAGCPVNLEGTDWHAVGNFEPSL